MYICRCAFTLQPIARLLTAKSSQRVGVVWVFPSGLGLSELKYSLKMFVLSCMLPPSGHAESAAAGE